MTGVQTCALPISRAEVEECRARIKAGQLVDECGLDRADRVFGDGPGEDSHGHVDPGGATCAERIAQQAHAVTSGSPDSWTVPQSASDDETVVTSAVVTRRKTSDASLSLSCEESMGGGGRDGSS